MGRKECKPQEDAAKEFCSRNQQLYCLLHGIDAIDLVLREQVRWSLLTRPLGSRVREALDAATSLRSLWKSSGAIEGASVRMNT